MRLSPLLWPVINDGLITRRRHLVSFVLRRPLIASAPATYRSLGQWPTNCTHRVRCMHKTRPPAKRTRQRHLQRKLRAKATGSWPPEALGKHCATRGLHSAGAGAAIRVGITFVSLASSACWPSPSSQHEASRAGQRVAPLASCVLCCLAGAGNLSKSAAAKRRHAIHNSVSTLSSE